MSLVSYPDVLLPASLALLLCPQLRTSQVPGGWISQAAYITLCLQDWGSGRCREQSLQDGKVGPPPTELSETLLGFYFVYLRKVRSDKRTQSPGWVAQLVGASSHAPEGCRFDPPSGHIPRFRVRYLVGWGMYGRQPRMVLTSMSFSLRSINVSAGDGLKKKKSTVRTPALQRVLDPLMGRDPALGHTPPGGPGSPIAHFLKPQAWGLWQLTHRFPSLSCDASDAVEIPHACGDSAVSTYKLQDKLKP